MKTTTLALTLVSHAGLVLLGGWLAGGLRHESDPGTSLPAPAIPKTATPSPAGEVSANPIFRATGADFQAAWDELLENGQGTRESLFVDWCAVDPDGAIQALGRLHPARTAEEYLRAAQMYHAAKMAPALIKHWRKLQRLPEYKVQFALGWSVNELAKEDPQAAATLLGSLPPGMRTKAYDRVFSKLDGAVVGQLVKNLPPLPPDAIEEKMALWTEVAGAVDGADMQRGLWDWMANATDPIARRALVTEGINKAYKAEDWSGFFDAVERMDESARTEVRDLVRKSTGSNNYPAGALAAISAECRRHGLDDWIEEKVAE